MSNCVEGQFLSSVRCYSISCPLPGLLLKYLDVLPVILSSWVPCPRLPRLECHGGGALVWMPGEALGGVLVLRHVLRCLMSFSLRDWFVARSFVSSIGPVVF